MSQDLDIEEVSAEAVKVDRPGHFKRPKGSGYRTLPEPSAFTKDKLRLMGLLNRAEDLALGKADCTPSQARALALLLSKMIPDLKSTEIVAGEGSGVEIKIVTGIERD